MVHKAQEPHGVLLGQLRTSCEASLFYLQFSSTNIIMQLESNPVPCGKKSCSEHHTLFLACVRGSGLRLIAQREKRQTGRKKTERGTIKQREGWKEVVYIYSTHIAVTMDQPTCNLVFQIILPSDCALCPLWKSSCVAEGETVVAASWTQRLQRVGAVMRGDICLEGNQNEEGGATRSHNPNLLHAWSVCQFNKFNYAFSN